jgi:AcrR family transcriptional regulator
MSPRPYTPVIRQQAVDAGRERVVTAARELLEDDGAEGFSLDAVARRAGVSRMTVYNQFGSKAGVLEAIFDSIAANGPFKHMPDIFAETDPRVALDEFITLFGKFWTYSRRAHARLATAAATDADLAAIIASRNERRRLGTTEIVRRLGSEIQPIVPKSEVVNLLFVLLSFDHFDALAGKDRTPNDVVPLVRATVYAVLGLPPKRARRKS